MRGAPPVQVALGAERRWQGAVAGLNALAAATITGWLVLHAGAVARDAAIVALLAAGVAGTASLKWRPKPGRTLAWDGQRWMLDGAPGKVDVMLDLGAWLLLRFQREAPSSVAWLPVSLDARALQATPFRVALYAHAGHTPVGARALGPGARGG